LIFGTPAAIIQAVKLNIGYNSSMAPEVAARKKMNKERKS